MRQLRKALQTDPDFSLAKVDESSSVIYNLIKTGQATLA